MVREGSFFTDGKRIQALSGLTAAAGILATILLSVFSPVSDDQKIKIWIVVGIVTVFIAIFNSFPKIYLDKRLTVVSDVVYIFMIALVMIFLGKSGSVLVILYMILVALDAFILPLSYFALVVLGSMLSIACISAINTNIFSSDFAFHMYGLAILAIVARVVAKDALLVKEEKETSESEIIELESNKREIRNLLESLSDGMFVVNAENMINFYNKAALSILKIVASEDKILGRNINDFLPTIGPDGPEIITNEVFGSLSSSVRNNFKVVRGDRTIKIHTNVTPVLEEGKLKGAIIFFRDITNEKNLDEQRAEFNAIASHEIRTPLTVIEGYLFFLLDPASKAKYDSLTKEYIKKAHEASQDLIHLITDILTVIRAEENSLSVNLKKVSLKEFTRDIVLSFKNKAKEKGLIINFKVLTKKEIPEVITDPVKLKEMISNYIENAIKFTEKGLVTVELGLLASEVLISVIDTGTGIEHGEQSKIFDKFYRTEDWKTRKTGGTGLGLFIVKTLAERLGGRVGVQSEIGKGSKFFFTIPVEYKNKKDLKEFKEGK